MTSVRAGSGQRGTAARAGDGLFARSSRGYLKARPGQPVAVLAAGCTTASDPAAGVPVSGDVEARSLVGRLSFKTVSGELILVEGRLDRVQAHSVTGDVVLDVAAGATPDIAINTVSGDVTVRLPDQAGLDVDLASMSGELSSVFPGLSIESRPGRRRLSGRLGDGGGRLSGKTMSGSFALLDRRRGNGHPAREAS